jgi:hypothetical protein
LAVTEDNCVSKQKKKDTFPCPFQGVSPRENQEEQTDYMLNTTPDDLARRKATNAKPRRPVPSRKRLLGSGVAVMAVAWKELLVPFTKPDQPKLYVVGV